MPSFEIGVLDLLKMLRGSPEQGIAATVAVARAADRLGFSRFWVAEHHSPDAASASPEAIVPILAARTRRIVVGAGGVLLPYYSPLKVAETFRALAAAFPGRIDLGVGKGPGVPGPDYGEALRDSPRGEVDYADYERRLEELASFVRYAALPPDHRHAPVRAHPLGVAPPRVWLLGSGEGSMRVAARLGLDHCFGHFLYTLLGRTADVARDSAAVDRELVGPSPRSRRGVALTVLAAPTRPQAERADRAGVAAGAHPHDVVGDAADVKRGIEELARAYRAETVMIMSTNLEPRVRLRTLAVVSAAFSLGQGPPPPVAAPLAAPSASG